MRFGVAAFLVLLPLAAHADRYAIYDEYGGGGPGLFSYLLMSVAIGFGWLAIIYKLLQPKRVTEHSDVSKKKEPFSLYEKALATFFIFVIAAMLALPFLFIIKYIYGSAGAKDSFFYITTFVAYLVYKALSK